MITTTKVRHVKLCANDLTSGPKLDLTFGVTSLLMLAKSANEPDISPNI